MIDLASANPLDLIGKGRVQLLQSSGAYNISRYPWAYDYWKKQQQVHWMGEEIPLGEDLKDWAGDRVSDEERNLLTQIFRFFTQSDVEVSDNYLKRYMPIFQPLEIQMMLAAFTNIETIHIDAYALLLTTLGMPQTEFEAFRDYSEMQAKADYMHSFWVNPDCGLKTRRWEEVIPALENMVAAAKEMRDDHQFSSSVVESRWGISITDDEKSNG